MELTKKLRLWIVSIAALMLANVCLAQGWTPLRTSGTGSKGWQSLVCETGKGWRSCEMPVNIVLTANPVSLVAIGEQTTITAAVTDYYGVAIVGLKLDWTSTDGAISIAQNITDENGKSTITLTSSHTLGGSTVTAEAESKDGKGSIWIPYIDKFVATTSTYTGYSNYGAPYSCTAWTPDPSTVAAGTSYWQTANCWQAQIRYRQDREKSVVTGQIRNVGGAVSEFQYIVITQSQLAVGTQAPAKPTTCTYSTPFPASPSTAAFVTIDPQGAKGIINAETVLDGFMGVPNAGMGPSSTTTHGTQVWNGYIDYKGYRYTSGQYRELNVEYGSVYRYYFELCKTPL